MKPYSATYRIQTLNREGVFVNTALPRGTIIVFADTPEEATDLIKSSLPEIETDKRFRAILHSPVNKVKALCFDKDRSFIISDEGNNNETM